MTDSLREQIAATLDNAWPGHRGQCEYLADALLASDGPIGQLVVLLENEEALAKRLAVRLDEGVRLVERPGRPMPYQLAAWCNEAEAAARAALGRDET